MSKLNWKNRTLFHKDNLDIMRGMDSETIDLIATDPPFNKGRDFHATPSALKESGSSARFQDRWSWKDDVQGEWVDDLQNDNPHIYEIIMSSRKSYGDDMGAFLCYMAVRLLAMHRLLKPTGSLYLHCDPTASHYLKMLLDTIFGRKHFRNEIIWQRNDNRAKGSQHAPRKYGANTDTILFYTKSDEYVFEPYLPFDEKDTDIIRQFPKTDKNGRRYKTGIPIFCSKSMGARPHLCYEWRGFKNPHPSGWRMSKERLEAEYQKGNVVIKDNGKLERRLYMKEWKGPIPDNNWTDISRVGKGEEYPTEKPLALYERIIRASSNKGDIVFDPFCGCATTVIAAERLGRQWVGCDIWDGAGDMIVKRLGKESIAVEDTDMVAEGRQKFLEWKDSVTITETIPERGDEGETAAPYLKPTVKRVSAEPPGPRMSREEMVNVLVEENGLVCQGCGWKVHDKRHLELDHNTPRSSGGINHISNRILLCGPCNRLKSDTLTLKGLQKKNKQLEYLVDRA